MLETTEGRLERGRDAEKRPRKAKINDIRKKANKDRKINALVQHQETYACGKSRGKSLETCKKERVEVRSTDIVSQEVNETESITHRTLNPHQPPPYPSLISELHGYGCTRGFCTGFGHGTGTGTEISIRRKTRTRSHGTGSATLNSNSESDI